MAIPLPDLEQQKRLIQQEESGKFAGIRLTTRLKFKEGFEQPDFQEVRNIKKSLNLYGTDMADLVGVSSRTVRKWMADPAGVKGQKSSNKIPYAAWRLLVLELEGKES